MPRQAGGRPAKRTPSRPGKKTSISNRSGGDKRSPRSTRSSTVSQVSKIYGSIIRAPEWANPHLTQQRLRQSLDDISYRVNRWRTRFRGLISRVRLRTERPRRWNSKRILFCFSCPCVKTSWAGVLLISYSRKFQGQVDTQTRVLRNKRCPSGGLCPPCLKAAGGPGKMLGVRTGALERPGR